MPLNKETKPNEFVTKYSNITTELSFWYSDKKANVEL